MSNLKAADNQTHRQIGKLVFDAAQHQLCRGDECLYLEPRQYQLLISLLASNGKPVSRDQLIAHAWQGRIVSDGAINRAVSMLRKAMAELDPNTHYIETLPKLGYRLQPMPQPAAPNPATATIKTTLAPTRLITKAKLATLAAAGVLLVMIILTLFWLNTAKPPAHFKVVSTPTPQTSFDGAEVDISADNSGSSLLYHRQASNGNRQVWLNTLADNEHIALTSASENSGFANLSPNGQQVVYARYMEQQCELMLLDIATTELKQLATCPVESMPKIRWHHDGNHIYYRQRTDKTKPYKIFQLNVRTSASRQLTLPPSGYSGQGDLALAISAEGVLAVGRYLSASSSLLLFFNAQTGELLQQQQLNIAIRELAWHNTQLLLSDDKRIYYYHQQQLQDIYQSADPIQSVAVSQNSIFFSTVEQRSDIWRQDATGQLSPVINSSRLDIMPRIAHDGRRLAFLTTRQGQHQLWHQDASSKERLLTELPGVRGFARLSWSADDSQILLVKDNAAYAVSVPDGKISLLLAAEKQVAVANWANDDQSLIYSSNRSGDWQLWQYDLLTGAELQLTQHGGYSGLLWQGQLYFTRYHQDGLWRKSLTEDNEQLVLAQFDKINWLNWQLDAGILHYYQPNQGVYRYHLASEEHELQLAEMPDFVRHFSVHGQNVYFVKQQPVQGDVYRLSLL